MARRDARAEVGCGPGVMNPVSDGFSKRLWCQRQGLTSDYWAGKMMLEQWITLTFPACTI